MICTGNVINIVWVFVTCVLVGITIYFYGEIRYLTSEIEYAWQEFEHTQTELHNTYVMLDELSRQHTTLQQQYDSLHNTYLNLSAEYNDLHTKYLEMSEEHNIIIDTLHTYIDRIDTVYLWLKDTAKLPNRIFEREIRRCADDGYINYPCILLRREYRYIPDIFDKVTDPIAFTIEGGGDCEDYSFYASALLHTAKEKGYGLKGFQKGNGKFWITPYWYYDDAEDVTIYIDDIIIVCGWETEANADEYHCLLEITSTNGQTYLFEPQTGEFLPLHTYEILERYVPTKAEVNGIELNTIKKTLTKLTR